MQILKSRFSDGSSLPVLVRKEPYQPILVPFIYNVIHLKGKADNTKRNIFTSIKYFYSFIESEYNMDVDELLIMGKFHYLIGKIDEFVYWIGLQDFTRRQIQLTETRDAHLRNLKDYFSWTATRYVKDDSHLTAIQFKIKGAFEASQVYTSSKKFTYKSLIEKDVQLIEAFSDPAHSLNPYRHPNRFRNWLIIQLLLKLGLRIGELQKLQCKDIYKFDNGNYYVQVIDHENDPLETRKKKPSLKNKFSQRTISISEDLYNACNHYIVNLRRPIRNGRKRKISTGYLFLSERADAISANTINEILRRLGSAIRDNHPKFSNSLSPHVFRHTFAEGFLRYLIDTLCFDMDRAKDHLRTICGWSTNSPMPNFYGARYIAERANKENLSRIFTARK